MDAVGANGAEVRGSACGFSATCDKVKGKEAKERIMAKGVDIKRTSGSGEITTSDLLGQDTGNSGGVGGPTDYFRRMYKGYRL